MLKPSSSACNLTCDYCFYLHTAANRKIACHSFMKKDVMLAIITKSLAAAERLLFVFQGGEPSLIGLPFYEEFVATVHKLNTDAVSVNYAFQTNGTHINIAWATFFKKHNFLVGVSFDGSPRLHDFHRFDSQGNKSARSVRTGIAILREQQIEFNLLTVVTNELALNVDLVWNYMRDHGHRYLQFIPCMTIDNLEPIEQKKSFLTAENYALFLKRLFDHWYQAWAQCRPVSIRFFDNLAGMYIGLPPESCDMAGLCSVQYVVESDGSVFPCDFYCDDASVLGTIREDDFFALDIKRAHLRFVEDSPNTINLCDSCPWKSLCRGGCKRYREESGYRFCASMLEFFPYVIDRLQHVAGTLK